ncbi:hypothetical protein CDAR_576251 [Caerostris darwini]|uniref:Uncharacterized protein n=1 Tax=Caerostris darwini TaxID=1538125 RepID=A0AAV4Q7C9_9ARAC|nr:hypothetical protein CDAR_576251 [Caerostris darwini]
MVLESAHKYDALIHLSPETQLKRAAAHACCSLDMRFRCKHSSSLPPPKFNRRVPRDAVKAGCSSRLLLSGHAVPLQVFFFLYPLLNLIDEFRGNGWIA